MPHNADGLDILLGDTEAVTNEALTMFSVLVGPGHLELILTQVGHLPSTFQVHLHELNLLRQTVDDPMKVSVLFDFGGNAPLRHFVNFFIKYLPVGFVGV